MASEKNTKPFRSFLMPWDHTGNVPFNQEADKFIRTNEGNIAYLEEAAVTHYGMNWYCVTVWLKE